MAHFLLAWELGANLGHATRLRSVAIALKAAGHRVSFAARDVAGSRHHLGTDLGPTLQAPLFLGQASAVSWTMADVLLSCGFGDSQVLGALAGAWRALFELSGCDALVADHAPTALLAARASGLPALHIGHGFTLPPRVTPLPIFRDWAKAPTADHSERSDARALAHANAVLAAANASALPALCELFYPRHTVLCTWPELDHHAGAGRDAAAFHGPDCEFAPGIAPQWPPGPGPHVFAYLRAAHPDHAAVLRALAQFDGVTVCFMPDAPAQGATLPRTANIHCVTEPVDMRQVVADCALVICHAGQATVAQALLAGIPLLLLPLQAEQFLMARQVERTGSGVNVASLAAPVGYASLIHALSRVGNPHAAAARAVALRHRSFDPAALTVAIARAASDLLTRQ